MSHRRVVVVAVASTVAAACGTASSASPFVTVPSAPTTTAPVSTVASTPPAQPPTPPTTPTTPTTQVPAASPNPSGDGQVTIAFTGDALWHSPLWRGAEQHFAAANGGGAGRDFRPMLAGLSPVLESVDLAVCHLETPIAPEGEEFTTAPLYGVPPEVVVAIAAAGFDRCSLASNHSFDRGAAGIDRTVTVLEQHGIGFSGMARTPAEIEPRVFTVDGVVVSHLSYTFGYNGAYVPPGEEWRSALIDPKRIVADAQQARRRGAELVVVSLHWGDEGESAISAQQRRVAEAVTASGAVDLIVGHHAHVLQPIEQVNGVWVIFGLGNIISNMPTGWFPPASQDGAVAVVDVVIADGVPYVGRPVIHPTWVDRDNGWIVHLVRPALADPATSDRLRAELQLSLDRTSAVLGEYLAD